MELPLCDKVKVQRTRYFLIGLFWLSGLCLKAQEDNWRLTERVDMIETNGDSSLKATTPGAITIFQDERIAKLDSLKRRHPGKQSGYRVQIFFGKRPEALKMKAEFQKSHSEVPAYISYLAPNFRLRVGDFRTRLEAEKLKREIDTEYSGCYIVRDKIELPVLSQDQSEK